MDSFYGGQPGISFIIVKSFDSVNQMVKAFQKGGDYEEVKYGEYVIIDTVINLNNKSSLENGLVYCRGLDYLEPAAQVPQKEDFPDESTGINQKEYELAMRSYFKKPGGGAVYIGQIVGPQGQTPYLKFLSESEVKLYSDEYKGSGTLDVVSGKTNNRITYAYCNIRDDYNNVAGCMLGITIPYHVIEINSESADPYDGSIGTYDEESNTWSYKNLIKKLSGNDDSRPYYSLWDLKIPKGIHGADVSKMGIDPDTKEYYFEIKSYDKSEEGEINIYYTGFYHKVIDSITFDNETSEFVITYSTQEDQVRIKARFIYDVSIDPDTQKIKVTYSDSQDGQKVSQLIGEPIKFISSIEYNKETQKIKVNYNTGDSEEIDQQLKVITNTDIDENAKLNIHYNTGDIDIIDEPIKVIDNITLNNENKIVITYNTKETQIIDYAFKFLKDININEENLKVKVTYIVGKNADGSEKTETKDIGSALNYVQEMKVNPETYHLLVLYADPVMREKAKELNKAETCDDFTGVSHDDWWNLGYVRGDSGGIHIVGDVASEEELPEEGPPKEYQGWIYTVTIDGVSTLYAYDYTYANKGWYPIGSLDASLTKPISVMIISEADATGLAPQEGGGNLNEDGYWFIVENR